MLEDSAPCWARALPQSDAERSRNKASFCMTDPSSERRILPEPHGTALAVCRTTGMASETPSTLSRRQRMKLRNLIAIAVAGAFAVPIAAQASDASAANDSFVIAQGAASGTGVDRTGTPTSPTAVSPEG